MLAKAVARVDATRPTPSNPDFGVDGIARDLSAAYGGAIASPVAGAH
jgi:hypothetical protein